MEILKWISTAVPVVLDNEEPASTVRKSLQIFRSACFEESRFVCVLLETSLGHDKPCVCVFVCVCVCVCVCV